MLFRSFGHVDAHAPPFLIQKFTGQSQTVGSLLDPDPVLDARPDLAQLDELEPVPAGTAGRVGDDLHGVAVFKGRVQGHDAAVDLGPGAMIAHFRVDQIGEVHGRAPFGQFLDLAFGRENVHLVLKQVEAQSGHEIAGILEIALPVQNLAQPAEAVGILGLLAAPLLVGPVGGHAVFRQDGASLPC